MQWRSSVFQSGDVIFYSPDEILSLFQVQFQTTFYLEFLYCYRTMLHYFLFAFNNNSKSHPYHCNSIHQFVLWIIKVSQLNMMLYANDWPWQICPFVKLWVYACVYCVHCSVSYSQIKLSLSMSYCLLIIRVYVSLFLHALFCQYFSPCRRWAGKTSHSIISVAPVNVCKAKPGVTLV